MDKQSDNIIDIFTPNIELNTELPISDIKISAGFPSPADDFMGMKLDLNRELIKNPASTFYARVKGDSMIDAGINDNDLLVIDKSIEPYSGCIAVCFIDGEFTLKHFENHEDFALLIPANQNYNPIKVDDNNNFIIWGVVRYIIKKV